MNDNCFNVPSLEVKSGHQVNDIRQEVYLLQTPSLWLLSLILLLLCLRVEEGRRQSKREKKKQLIGHRGSLIVSLDAKCQCESQISASSHIEGKIAAH